MSEKEIILLHNEFEIPLNITSDYNESINALKKKIYFQDKDMENYSLYYLDEEGDEVDVDEDQFDDAYNSSKWGLRKQDKEEANPSVDISEVKAKFEENAQKYVNAKINKIKKDLMDKFTKIFNEKISANNLKYEEKIKKLEQTIKSLKEKYKQIIETMKKSHEDSVNSIINQVSQFAGNEIMSHMSKLDKDFDENLKTGIYTFNNETGKIVSSIQENIENVGNQQKLMSQSLDASKSKFLEIYQMSQAGINQK